MIAIIFSDVDRIAVKLKIRQEVSMGLCWLVLVGLMFAMPEAKLLGVEYIAYYYLYYILGYYIHKHSEQLIIRNRVLLVVVGLLWFGLGSIYSTQGLPEQLRFVPLIPSSLLYYAYRVITAVLAIFFLFSLGKMTLNEEKGLVKYSVVLGKVSLGIYAIHMVVRFRLVDAIVYFIPNISYEALMVITFILLIPISYGVVWLLNGWRITSKLFLGKINHD